MREGARRAGRRALATVGLALLVAGCQASPPTDPKPTTPLSPQAQGGRNLFPAKGCIACHRAPGVPEATGTIGPDLRGVGSRPKIAAVLDNTPENMKNWLLDPQKVKPGTAMPSLGLNETEATSLAAFLEELK